MSPHGRHGSPTGSAPPAGEPAAQGAQPDELQLPMLGLYADVELGRGSVQLPDEFLQCSGAVQAEVIRDWQRGLQRYQHAALLRLQQELAAALPGADAAEQQAHFRATCKTLGLVLPADFMPPAADR